MTGLSRRDFGRIVGTGVAAANLPTLFAQNPPAAPRSTGAGVRLSANENPYGPSPAATTAMRNAIAVGNRYPDDVVGELVSTIAKLHQVSADQIILGDGSSEILKLTAAAFCGPTRKVVIADPTFEAIGAYARAAGADVVKIPLTSSYEHDLAKMAAVPGAGAIYVCNPNNPTASITNKQAVRSFLQAVPPETMVLVDEAYFHYADSPDYESMIPLVKDHPNLTVSRTFSKIYGMAGLRCGYCVAQKDTIKRIRPHQMWDSVNIMALAAASASLNDPDQVPNGRRLNNEVKAFVTSELEKMGCQSIPSQANFFMFDCKRPVVPLIQALKGRNVYVGRLFPALPNYMRVTVGRKSEVETFLSAFRQSIA